MAITRIFHAGPADRIDGLLRLFSYTDRHAAISAY